MRNYDKALPLGKAFSLNARTIKLFFKRYPSQMLSRVLYTAWSAITPYVAVYLSALIIDELSSGRNVERLTELVIITLISAAVIAIITALLKKWYEVQNTGLWYKVFNLLAEKTFEVDYSKLEETETSALISEIKENQNSGGWGLEQTLLSIENLTTTLFKIIGGISLTVSLFLQKIPESQTNLLFLNNPVVNILIVAVMFGTLFISPALSNKAVNLQSTLAGDHNLGNRLFSFFGFLGSKRDIAMDIRIYEQNKMCEKYNRSKNDTFASNGKFAKLSRGALGILEAVAAAIYSLFTGFVYLFVCVKALGGAYGLGSVTQYVTAITMLSGGIRGFVATLGMMRGNAKFLEIAYSYLDLESAMQKGEEHITKDVTDNLEIEFKDVSFKYPSSENYALNNVNFKLNLKKRFAIVGMNGSGKTTFIKLLCRLYDPTSGKILLNGKNIKEYSYEEYLDIFSVVFQDFKLLGLMLKNVVASNSIADEEKVASCLEKAGFSESLAKMEKGLDTYISKDYDMSGVTLSGGEAQKVALARALYKDSPFVVLDEPTAALDPIAEAEIYAKFDEIANNKTAIYISHRLSSCKFCDEIAVFESGRIVQTGTHDSLVSDKNGKYFELWNAQAKYYQD